MAQLANFAMGAFETTLTYFKRKWDYSPEVLMDYIIGGDPLPLSLFQTFYNDDGNIKVEVLDNTVENGGTGDSIVDLLFYNWNDTTITSYADVAYELNNATTGGGSYGLQQARDDGYYIPFHFYWDDTNSKFKIVAHTYEATLGYVLQWPGESLGDFSGYLGLRNDQAALIEDDDGHEGENIAIDSADIQFTGVIQPATAALLLALPENQRENIEYMLHTRHNLREIIRDFEEANVYIRYGDYELKLMKFEDFSQWGFYRYFLQNPESSQGR